jgi:hypothetical protein
VMHILARPAKSPASPRPRWRKDPALPMMPASSKHPRCSCSQHHSYFATVQFIALGCPLQLNFATVVVEAVDVVVVGGSFANALPAASLELVVAVIAVVVVPGASTCDVALAASVALSQRSKPAFGAQFSGFTCVRIQHNGNSVSRFGSTIPSHVDSAKHASWQRCKRSSPPSSRFAPGTAVAPRPGKQFMPVWSWNKVGLVLVPGEDVGGASVPVGSSVDPTLCLLQGHAS